MSKRWFVILLEQGSLDMEDKSLAKQMFQLDFVSIFSLRRFCFFTELILLLCSARS